MTENLWHCGIRGVLFRDSERGLYVATFHNVERGPIEATTYEICKQLWECAAEHEAHK